MHYKKLEETLSRLVSAGYSTPINSIFDIGANKGKWTQYWSAKYPEAVFSLFEANPAHKRPRWLDNKHQWFSTLLSKPGVDSIDFYRMPNTEHNGAGDSYYKEVTPHYTNQSETIKLKAMTLDSVVESNNLLRPQLVKLDTQGSEVDILLGAKKTFETVDVAVCEMPIVEYNRGAPTYDQYMDTFKDLGFTAVGIDETHFNNFKVLIQIDMVFVKNHIAPLVV